MLLIWRILQFYYLGMILESCASLKGQHLHICAYAFNFTEENQTT